MHAALVKPEHEDDFIVLRAVAFTSRVRRAMVRDVLSGEDLAILEWRLLLSVARFGSCHLAYITRRTSIDPAHGSRAAAALERKGLISRADDPKNKRRKLISLTPASIEVFERVCPRARSVVKTATDQLAAEDFDQLKSLLDLLNRATEPLLQKPEDRDDRPGLTKMEKIAAASA